LCFLICRAPEGQDGPQDAVVGPAEDELDRWRRCEALARAAPGDEASQAQDLFVISAAERLPGSSGADGVNQIFGLPRRATGARAGELRQSVKNPFFASRASEDPATLN
jgi:hypothetical protein